MVAILMQGGLRRSLELSQGAVREMSALHVVNSCVLVRAAFETACLIYDVLLKVEDVIAKNEKTAIDGFSNYLSNALLGHGPKAKHFMLTEERIVQNILTIIQRLSKLLDAPFEGFYEGLCEYSHPNYHGVMGMYTEVGHKGGSPRSRTDERAETSLQ